MGHDQDRATVKDVTDLIAAVLREQAEGRAVPGPIARVARDVDGIILTLSGGQTFRLAIWERIP